MPAHQYSLKSFRDLLAAYIAHCEKESGKLAKDDPATAIYEMELAHLRPLQTTMDQALGDEKLHGQSLTKALNTAFDASKDLHVKQLFPRGQGGGLRDSTLGIPHDDLNFNNSKSFADSVALGYGTKGHNIISMCRRALAHGLVYIQQPNQMDVLPLEKIKLIVKRIDEAMESVAKLFKLKWVSPIPEESFFATLANFFKSAPPTDAKAQAAKDPNNNGAGFGGITFGDAPAVAAAPAAPKPGSRTTTSIN